MSKVQFEPGFFGNLGKSSEMSALIESRIDPVIAEARRRAPVKSGRYRNGIIKRKRYAQYRVVWEAVATDGKSLLLEAKLGIMARALRSAGRGR